MRKILLTLLVLAATTSNAQLRAPKIVDEHIKTMYGESYSVIKVDTVAMPIRMVLSLDFTMALLNKDAAPKIKQITSYTGETRAQYAKQLVEEMEQNISELITEEDIIAMRNSIKPHKDNYYNYQRTIVYLKTSDYYEHFYVRIGETSISMTRTEYDIKEESAFAGLNAYKHAISVLKDVIKQSSK